MAIIGVLSHFPIQSNKTPDAAFSKKLLLCFKTAFKIKNEIHHWLIHWILQRLRKKLSLFN